MTGCVDSTRNKKCGILFISLIECRVSLRFLITLIIFPYASCALFAEENGKFVIIYGVAMIISRDESVLELFRRIRERVQK